VSAREAFDAARGAGWGSANFSALALLYAPDAR
jgi:hypothetical protein